MINQMPLQQWVQEVWEDLLAWGHRRLPGTRAFLSLWRIHPTASAIAYPFGHSFARTTQSTNPSHCPTRKPCIPGTPPAVTPSICCLQRKPFAEAPQKRALVCLGEQLRVRTGTQLGSHTGILQTDAGPPRGMVRDLYRSGRLLHRTKTARDFRRRDCNSKSLLPGHLLSVNGQTVSDSGGKIVVFRK